MQDVLAGVARRWWLFPLLFVVTAGSVAVNLDRTGENKPWGVVLAVAATLVLFAIDRWPLAVVVNGALVALYFALGAQSGPIFFTVIAATFIVAERRVPRVWFPLVLASTVLVWIGLLVRGLRFGEGNLGWWQSLGIGALVSAAAAVATTLRARRDARAERVTRVATEERLRMAQELHDGVGHGLAVIAMQSGVALHVLDRDPAAVRPALEAIRDLSREALDSLRAELTQLQGGSAPRAPRHGLADLDGLVARVDVAGVAVRRGGRADLEHPRPLPADVDAAAYAVVQEALTNVLRHADATTVTLGIDRRDDTLVVTVTDDGRGGEVHDEGMGLTGMRDWVSALGGSLEAGPVRGGFEVRAVFPA